MIMCIFCQKGDKVCRCCKSGHWRQGLKGPSNKHSTRTVTHSNRAATPSEEDIWVEKLHSTCTTQKQDYYQPSLLKADIFIRDKGLKFEENVNKKSVYNQGWVSGHLLCVYVKRYSMQNGAHNDFLKLVPFPHMNCCSFPLCPRPLRKKKQTKQNPYIESLLKHTFY